MKVIWASRYIGLRNQAGDEGQWITKTTTGKRRAQGEGARGGRGTRTGGPGAWTRGVERDRSSDFFSRGCWGAEAGGGEWVEGTTASG